ncbi:MAG: hypothetical protein A2W90_15110 [Bacteroidetes bacterium GWF2_42_66]|nr:MAG: hypothetical protein A2W89_07120 [Bacteroidetes bacterium GWE2_42_39]OFY46639.1 MAG: hypothetical protein A2W90_15110 [Bacteroidetes bacterium GWF2_42_66]HBL74764.1 hypothetical protein [Prolixibacteraceae bacterium]HCU59493.1 hypothetical protein [Prolixibacteraceae bacterium]
MNDMKNSIKVYALLIFFLLPGVSMAQKKSLSLPENKAAKFSACLPDNILPVQACWFWSEEEFFPDGYKSFIDTISLHSPFNLISTSVRLWGREIMSDAVHKQMKLAAEYAAEKGISLVADLDVRTARRAFESQYPNELQEMLLLKEIGISEETDTEITIFSKTLTDHYTGRTTPYISLYGKLLRVYSYIADKEGIEANSLEDITRNCIVVHSCKDSVRVQVPAGPGTTKACVMVSFTHLSPDVFAPHIIAFQREIIRRYSDVPLVGVFKDEWGFPPCFDGSPAKDQFWYSKARAKAYSERTGGRDLLSDCLLMHRNIKGKERERQRAINHFMEMSWQRNAEIESDYYHAVKETFGPDAIVTTHPTWWPYPDLREQMKNGLFWWAAKRDWAQTDEYTPFAVRTALAKKWGSPIWYNMFYSTERADYEKAVWSAALGGGRINYHPLYPSERKRIDKTLELLRGELVLAESRVRMLNFISKSPLDCPVAVVFGHACTMNWAGPAYDDVGMDLVNALWKAGVPTDLIPTSEIESKSLQVDEEGWIRYGQQKYLAVILYHPEFEKPSTAAFFDRAAKGKTRLFRMGDWTKNFEAKDFDGNSVLSEIVVSEGKEQLLATVKNILKQQKFELQSPATEAPKKQFGHPFISPPTTGICHLIDGSVIHIAGTNRISGDPIHIRENFQGVPISFDAEGVAAFRLDKNGKVEALAAGGLKSFQSENFQIELKERLDLAIWKNEKKEWQGIIQGWKKEIPSCLLKITNDWQMIDLPIPAPEPK